MKGYKAFKKGLICEPTPEHRKQYAENTVYEEDEADVCHSGMHFCKEPLSVLRFYNPVDDNGELTEYAEVEALDKCLTDDNIKYCTKKLKIGAKLDIAGLCKAQVEFVKENCEPTKANSATGNRSAASNTGDCSAASNTGDYSAASNTGDCSAASNTGDYSAASVSGNGSVALVVGYDSEAKASKGSAIVICERGKWNGKTHPLIGIKAAIVDGEKIKADTWYKLENGQFVEVTEE